ncbi:TonB-dependent receptor domain-containing protein [Tamlana crocina]|uniref:TonB-dependent receptor n=1 Tax=Tamlana crocina TaxID=393006 RepID=A0ABX1DBJ8_9FLAO|nr:TonB-dependent receptor [Tamlana crocina]NJX15729.1 TonB-dependent receptor [Tamlana crocina]
MTLKAFKLIAALLFSLSFYAQNSVNGSVYLLKNNKPIAGVEVYDKTSGLVATTNSLGEFQFETIKKHLTLVFFSFEYEVEEIAINTEESQNLNITLKDLTTTLSEVEITARKRRVFDLRRLNDVEGTAIYAGKKTEVVLLDESMANLATNNARQIYSQVAGLNIYQNDDAGLQLNIGGRGLDPNRTANFNTRQNGYDISADVLGYPESYYTPASEGISEIQVIRGAASLQYGTQFGGLINFKMKEPNPNKSLEVITRNTLGSYGLYTNFTSLSGTKDKFSYYGYFNYKKGDGFRPNSEFESKNVFAHLGYQFSEKTSLTGNFTHLHYLAQQAGGLTDNMFYSDPYQSNRARNWFKVNWLLYNLKFAHEFSENTNFTFNFFGLNASRKAIGFRIRRVDLEDTGEERELLVGDFKNFGFEGRLLSKYELFGKKATYILGAKFYKANNSESQGPGTDGTNANFNSALGQYPDYRFQGDFNNPNENIALFGEHIFYFSDKFSVTPGMRFEYIQTESNGLSRRTNFDAAGNPIGNEDKITNELKERSFVLLGVGASYKPSPSVEMYSNISQNYRSITFSDVNIVNPSNAVDSSLEDENGFTVDLGLRGNWNNWLSYDMSAFGLFYKDRIGFLVTTIPPVNNVGQLRTNIGDARILGVESLLDFNFIKAFNLPRKFSFNYFINTSFITSEYTRAVTSGIKGNKVEFIPDVNLKTGVHFAYKNLKSSIQYTYLDRQFTDAENSNNVDVSGIVGEIPAYDILDVSLSYSYKNFKLETGINNLLDNAYFTRRATGYPGPGIIPSAPRNWYATLQIKI